MASAEDEATLSIPSLAFVAFLSFFIIRYFISSRSDDSPTRRGQRFTVAQVNQVVQMFPQLSQRDIMWDLQRNGGSVAATTERILGGRGLEPAPPSFQPVLPVASDATSSLPTILTAKKEVEPDLITRYNLQSRINPKGKEKAEDQLMGWESNKDKRQEQLQRRRDEMILAARRRMQDKDLE